MTEYDIPDMTGNREEIQAARRGIDEGVNKALGNSTGGGHWAIWGAYFIIRELRVLSKEICHEIRICQR